jgi:polysaccharide biosynthesis transport protein
MQLRHYGRAIWHWLWLILLGIVICSVATFGISKFIIKPVYETTALVQVNGSPTSSSNNVFSNQALAVSYSLLITSTDTLQSVAKKIHGVSLNQLEQTVSASPQAGTQIIGVQVKANNPQLAADIANTVVSIFIQNQITSVNAQFKDLATQLTQDLITTKTSLDQAQKQLTSLQKSGASVDKIAHQNDIINTYQTNYNSFSANYRQVQLQEIQTTNAISIAQLAIPPDQPSSPHILQNTIIAAALGLLLMLALTLIFDWLDTSIQTPEDVAKLALLEPLGSVPFSEHPLLIDNIMNPSIDGDDTIKQTFMIINTIFDMKYKGPCAVLITGLRQGAGVTTSAINLATSFAQLGKRVLLIDANLGQPSLHEIFHCPNTRGLVNSLTDVYQFKEGIILSWLNLWRTNIPNLWLLPVGSAITHPQMAQLSKELRMLTNWLLRNNQNIPSRKQSETVDIIIFDASALNEGTDAIALATITDCSVLVVEAGKEQKEMVSKAGLTLQHLGSPVLGVIVNRQTAKHRPYFYTDHQRQNTMSVGSPYREENIESSSIMRQTSSVNTPPSLLSVNHSASSNGQLQSLPNGDVYDPTQLNAPSTLLPWDLPRIYRGSTRLRTLDTDHQSN